MEIDKTIINKALETWGPDAQTDLIQEECIELALAIQKYRRRNGDKRQQFLDLIDEIADVRIMIDQAFIIFPEELINERIQIKLERLSNRLDKHIF